MKDGMELDYSSGGIVRRTGWLCQGPNDLYRYHLLRAPDMPDVLLSLWDRGTHVLFTIPLSTGIQPILQISKVTYGGVKQLTSALEL